MKMEKTEYIHIYLLFFIFLILAITIFHFLGFRVMHVTGNIHWEAIAAIGQISAAIATFAAVLVALFPKQRKRLEMHLIFSPDQPSTFDTFAQLVVSNLGDRSATLKKIEFRVEDVTFGEISFISDGYWLARAEIISIETNQTKIIPIPYNEIRKHVGHIEIPEGKVYVTVTDILDNRYHHETKHSFDSFIDLVFHKVNEEVLGQNE